MVSLYRRGQIWWIAYRHQGRRFQQSLATTDRRIAERHRRELQCDLECGRFRYPSQTPLRPTLSAFCQKLMALEPPKAWRCDLGYLRTFFGPVVPELLPRNGARWIDPLQGRHISCELLEHLTPRIISAFLHDRIVRDRISPKTAANQREILHRFFAYAIHEHGFCSPDSSYTNPVSVVRRFRVPAPEIRFLSLEQIQAQLAALENDPVLHAAVAILIFAGLRREELLWLTPADVDLSKRLLLIRAKTDGNRSWQPKTRRNRIVPISHALLRTLQHFRPTTNSRWYIPAPGGNRWDPDNFSQKLRAANDKAGLAWSCLDYRHTFGSQLAQKGESLFQIACFMGNSPEICRRHYAILVPEKLHHVVDFGEVELANRA